MFIRDKNKLAQFLVFTITFILAWSVVTYWLWSID